MVKSSKLMEKVHIDCTQNIKQAFLIAVTHLHNTTAVLTNLKKHRNLTNFNICIAFNSSMSSSYNAG